MSDAAVADDKKEKEFPPLPKGNPEFTEKVTVKRWNPDKKVFNATKDNISALRFSGSMSQKCFYLKSEDVGATRITVGSVLLDADANEYEVIDSPQTSGNKLVRVKKKP